MIYYEFEDGEFGMVKTNNLKKIMNGIHGRYNGSTAHKIFRFEDNTTSYLKDRTGKYYQYSGEEQVVIALKAVLLY